MRGAFLLAPLALVAGLLGQVAGVPAPWLVGPMLVSVLFALARPDERPEVPLWARQVSQTVVGGVLAATFRPSVLPLVAREWLPVALAVCGTMVLSLTAVFLLSRLAHFDGKTAALGVLPGAASGMLVMSDSLGADSRLVALMQYGRVVLVVASAALFARFGGSGGSGSPFASGDGSGFLVSEPWMVFALTALVAVVGGLAGVRIGLPAGALLGPMILGVLLAEAGVAHVAWPVGFPQLAYAVIGVYVGLLFDRASVKRAGRLLPYMLASTLSLMAACAGFGWVFAELTGTDYLTAYLATTPGGIDSVAILAVGSGADASLVLSVQMFRLFAVIIAGAFVGRWWSSRD